MTGMVARYHKKQQQQTKQKTKQKRKEKEKEMENKSGYLKIKPVFDWQPVKCLEQCSNMLMSSLAKTTFAAWL